MRNAKDLANDALTSEAEHKRRAAALRRLAGGVRAHVDGVLNLTAKERKALADAQVVLERMAEVSKQAAALAKKRSADRAVREKAIRLAMKANFASLSSVGDQVALIVAVNNEVLTRAVANADSLRRLRDEFVDALDALGRSLARQGNDKKPDELVAQAWTRFERTKAPALAKHRALIDALTGA